MIPFLNIEYKVDSPSKQQAIVGQPTANYLRANEVNQMVNCINLLRELVRTNEVNISQLKNNLPLIELGTITGNFINVLNQRDPELVIPPTLITYRHLDIDYIQAFVGAQGNYGTGDLQFQVSDFVLLQKSDDATSQLNEPKVLKLAIKQNSVGIDPLHEVQKNTTLIHHFEVFRDDTGTFVIVCRDENNNWVNPDWDVMRMQIHTSKTTIGTANSQFRAANEFQDILVRVGTDEPGCIIYLTIEIY